MSPTWEEILEDETLSPISRAIFENRLRLERRREAERARLGEIGLHHRRVTAWQSDSLREFHKLLALQFEAMAWESREGKPLWSAEALNTVMRKSTA